MGKLILETVGSGFPTPQGDFLQFINIGDEDMSSKQRGFTLIELVVVIVILGILAVTALPKFIDLSGEAKTAALDGVAGAAASAMAVNYAGCAAKGHTPETNKCVKISTCEEVGNILQGGMPSGYTAKSADTGGTDPGTTNGVTNTCKVKQTSSGNTKDFTGIAAGN